MECRSGGLMRSLRVKAFADESEVSTPCVGSVRKEATDVV